MSHHGAQRIDLGRSDLVPLIEVTFDGRPISAREGEPLAAALLAAGVRIFRTMPDSGEPRGGFCFTGRCADCLMIVDGVSGVRACVTPVCRGMSVETQQGLGRPMPEPAS